MVSVLVTGCSRGIGLEFIRQLLLHSKPPSTLIATCRKPEDAKDLQMLAEAHQNLHILKFDVTDFGSYAAVVQQVEKIVGDRGLNVLINNAGVLCGKKTSLNDVNPEDMAKSFLTNSIAPVMVIKAFRALLKQAALNNKDKPIGWSRAAIVNISSQLGSLGNNTTGDFLEYRESKAALNQSIRSLTVELGKEDILIMALHPGWVQTDMGTSEATLTVKESVAGMLKVCYSLDPDQQGCFKQWDGKVLPW